MGELSLCSSRRASAKLVGFCDLIFSTSLFLVAVLLTTLPLWVHHQSSSNNKGSSSSSTATRDDGEYYYYAPDTPDNTPKTDDDKDKDSDPSIKESLLDSSRLSQTSTWVVLIGAPALLTFILLLAAIVLIQATNPKRPPAEALEMLRHWNWCSVLFGLILCGLYGWTAVVCLGPRFPPWPVPVLLLLVRGIFIYAVRGFQREVVYYAIPSKNCREPSAFELSMEAQAKETTLASLRKLPYDEHAAKLRELANDPNYRSDRRIFTPSKHGLIVNSSYVGAPQREVKADRVFRDFGGPWSSSSSTRKGSGSCDGALLQCVAPCAGISGGGGGKGGKRGRRSSEDIY